MSAAGEAPPYVFMGTSAFAVEVLKALCDAGLPPTLTVTPPDRGRGRGRKLAAPPVAEAARELGLDLHQTPSVNRPESIERIGATGAEAGMVCAFGQLIKEPLLGDLELLNVHPSLLPRWRGAAPIERAIMAGDERTGVCIIRLTAGLDSGPVALRREMWIGAEETFGELAARLASLGGEMSVEALRRLGAAELDYEPQPEEVVTYADKIEAADRLLDPRRSASELAAKVRGLHPHIGARLRIDEELTLRIGRAHPIEDGPTAGELEIGSEALLLGCGKGALAIDQLQPPGKRMMAAGEWIRGNPLPDRVPLG